MRENMCVRECVCVCVRACVCVCVEDLGQGVGEHRGGYIAGDVEQECSHVGELPSTNTPSTIAQESILGDNVRDDPR